MYEEQLQRLLADWKKAFKQYRNRKWEAEGACIRWEWTSGERYSVLPYHFERNPGRGRVIQDLTTHTGYFKQYGFDEQKRVRVLRSFGYRSEWPAGFMERLLSHPDGTQDLYSETFYQYALERVQSVEYSVAPHIPLELCQIDLEDSRVAFYSSFRVNGYTQLYGQKGKDPDLLYEWLGVNGRFKTAEEYGYNGNRLQRIQGYYEFPGSPPHTMEDRLTYGDSGKLVRIDRFYADGQRQVIYRKRRKGETFQNIRENTTHRLVEAILQRLKAAAVQEKVYCLILSYLRVNQHFPPYLVLVPETYRLQAIQSRDPEKRHLIYCPIYKPEWFLAIEDPETLEMCQVLEQEIQAGEKWDAAVSILRDIAQALNHQDINRILNVTEDFVVFAFDPEMDSGNLKEVLGSSASEKQIREWQDQGWLR